MNKPNCENQGKQLGNNCDDQSNEWEVMGKSWVSTLPEGQIIRPDEFQACLQSNHPHLPDHINSMPPPHLHHRLASIHSTIPQPTQGLPIINKANTDIVSKGEERKLAVPLPCNTMNKLPTDSDMYMAKRSEALHKYEILVDLEKQLSTLFPKPQLLNK